MTSGSSEPAGAFSKLPRLFVFACIGVVNTAADFAIYTALVRLAGWPPVAANICSYFAAVGISFVLNRNITFRQNSFRHGAGHQLARFAAINLAAVAISTALIHFLIRFTDPVTAKLLSIPATLAWGFVCSRRFVFSPSHRDS